MLLYHLDRAHLLKSSALSYSLLKFFNCNKIKLLITIAINDYSFLCTELLDIYMCVQYTK